MSTRSTYLEITNNILRELNEVVLTTSTFPNATNIQAYVKHAVNRAYMDLVRYGQGRWPWLATAVSQSEFLGNTYVETVAGTRWYLLNPLAADIEDDYSVVDWEHFTLTTEGVAGETAPYIYNKLEYITLEKWKDFAAKWEESDKSNNPQYAEPLRVIQNPDGRRFGLSGIPDKVYRVYFWAWKQPVKLSAATDVFPFREEFIPAIEARVRYYAWQFKENPQQAGFAESDWKTLSRKMYEDMVSTLPDRIEDDRVRYV